MTDNADATKFKVGLTGGIACGKSTLAELFAGLGVPVIDTDLISRELTAAGSSLLDAIAARFGAEILLKDGSLNRRRLREVIFADPKARKSLNALLHPAIFRRMQQLCMAQSAPYCICAVPLLFELHRERHFARILVCDVPYKTQIERLRRRDGETPRQARAILAAQYPRRLRRKRADDLVETDCPLEELQIRVAALHRLYLDMAAKQAGRFTPAP